MTKRPTDVANENIISGISPSSQQPAQHTSAEPSPEQAHILKWVELDLAGKFIRGGHSNILRRSTIAISKADKDIEIHELTQRTAREGISPGMLEAIPTEERFLWYLPFTIEQQDATVQTRVRVLFVSQDLFHTVVDFFDTKSNLTVAEKRIIFQIICNLSPKEAADADGVSVETKRSQLKSACAKMSCIGQSDLTRNVIGQMVHLLTLSSIEMPQGSVDAPENKQPSQPQ